MSGINFLKLLSPDAQKRIAFKNQYYAKRLNEIENLSHKNLVRTTKYYLSQMQAPLKYNANDCVYDAVFYHIIVPELLKRINKCLE